MPSMIIEYSSSLVALDVAKYATGNLYDEDMALAINTSTCMAISGSLISLHSREKAAGLIFTKLL